MRTALSRKDLEAARKEEAEEEPTARSIKVELLAKKTEETTPPGYVEQVLKYIPA